MFDNRVVAAIDDRFARPGRNENDRPAEVGVLKFTNIGRGLPVVRQHISVHPDNDNIMVTKSGERSLYFHNPTL